MQQSRNRIRRGLALILALLALVGSLTACGAQQGWRGKEIVVIDDNYRTWYEIFVYSFCDSDGDRVGDLQGVVSKLDYIQELGFNGIWLMPVMPAGSYHKYDVKDYLDIDPEYGTMADFERLAAECEKRGIAYRMEDIISQYKRAYRVEQLRLIF